LIKPIDFFMKLFNLSSKIQRRLMIILMASVVFICFIQTLKNGFVSDDGANYVENINYRGLSPSHLYWMLTTFHDANFHPFAWLTLAMDYVVWEMNPAGYHLTNLILHVLNTVLFYFLINALLHRTVTVSHSKLSGVEISAAMGALYFAIHPLRVETVAWVSTRGDVLCGFFYLITILAYLRMSASPSISERRKWYLIAVLFFLFSLLSRAWGITLPLVLLILDAYPLGRVDVRKGKISMYKSLLKEKTPFVVLALGTAILAFWAKKGSMMVVKDHGVVERFLQAMYGLCFYFWKTVLPARLSPFYLLDKNIHFMTPKYLLCTVFVCGITAGLFVMRRRWPWAITAWLCYALIVSPLLGFVQSGPQIAADRYTYISCLPFGVLAGAGIHRVWAAKCIKAVTSVECLIPVSLICLVLVTLFALSFRQTRIWFNNQTLLDHVLKLDSEHSIAYYDRGLLREKQGDSKGAFSDYTNVIRLDPEHSRAFNNRGVLRKKQGDLAGAIADFNAAIRLKPASPEAYANRGGIRLSQNDLEGAVQDFGIALEVASKSWPHRARLEQALAEIQVSLKQHDNR
jgi:regulator of sirC expression with transglutaminase-like and TPR domain